MIRYIAAFLILTAVIYFGITAWQTLSNSDKWSLVKSLTYSVCCAIIAFAILTVVVVVF